MSDKINESTCRCGGDCGGPDSTKVDRRTFLRAAGAAAAVAGIPAIAGPFERKDMIDHYVPIDKKLSKPWIKALYGKGEPEWFTGPELASIGMPIGGVAAGQVYLLGDGRLGYWGIFNQNINSGYGRINYKVGRDPEETVDVNRWSQSPSVQQGFAIEAKTGDRKVRRTLTAKEFPNTRFRGEYPIGRVEYTDSRFPLDVRLEAMSPFIPLNADDSTLPATILNYTVKNTSMDQVKATLAGWLENGVCYYSGEDHAGHLTRTANEVTAQGIKGVVLGIRETARERPETVRPPIVFADFEGESYGKWEAEGGAFGDGPAGGTLQGQQAVSGYAGKGLVNTFIDGDGPRGRLVSPEFTIERPYIGFLVGGGGHKGDTCMNLLVDRTIARTATGKDVERLEAKTWDVTELVGKRARFEIVDNASGGWGHINIDQIEFRDDPMPSRIVDLKRRADYGTMALAVLGGGDTFANPTGQAGIAVFGGKDRDDTAEQPHQQTMLSAVGKTVTIEPGEEKTIAFVVAWCMPNLYFDGKWEGNRYAEGMKNAFDVVRKIRSHYERLVGETRLWRDAYYDSTLPWWLLDRLHSTAANLATTLCYWRTNGRFWAWEGCGCCAGTCGHVWNYEHTMARLFPELERSVREMQDFASGVGFQPDSGAIHFRGESNGMWAGDAQGGYVLKAYREHLVSGDGEFLARNWRQIRKALEFLLEQDGHDHGLIEGSQHQTYDQNYHGANTMVGSLYLAALLAAENMALEMGDKSFAARCRRVFESGSKATMERLYNGEYFEQDVDLEKHPDWQYKDGCLADQLFGQGWAHQVGLGYIYPKDAVRGALDSIWRYCWAPDIQAQNHVHKPERWFAFPGEAGLFTCTWPRSMHLGPKSTRYRNELWTGIEYQVAGNMVWDGLLTEALAICRAIHERYHPSKRNPWNEIECGDHYARAMASWGVLTGLSGFEYDGPKQRIGFAPRITPENFKSIFTAAAGWGTYEQKTRAGSLTAVIDVKWGELTVQTLNLAMSRKPAKCAVNGQAVDLASDGETVTLTPTRRWRLKAGDTLEIVLT